MGDPITMDLSVTRDLNWGLSRLNLEGHTGEFEVNHLRFFIHPGIIQEQSITFVRDFYQWVYNFYSPVVAAATITSKNSYYPFSDGWVKFPTKRGLLPPTNAGYTLVDYRLPKKKAQ